MIWLYFQMTSSERDVLPILETLAVESGTAFHPPATSSEVSDDVAVVGGCDWLCSQKKQ